MKVLILDSGILINFSLNGLLDLLEKLKESFDGKFLITNYVKQEVIDRPERIEKFELSALKVRDLLDRKVIELPNSLGISESELNQETMHLMDIANHYLQSSNGWVKLVSEAEMSCLALSDQLSKKGIENMIAIDERTTRILAEKPENLERMMSERLKQRISLVAEDLNVFRKYRFIRSSELVFVCHKKDLFPIKSKNALEALLFATKAHGSSVSFEEINELKKL